MSHKQVSLCNRLALFYLPKKPTIPFAKFTPSLHSLHSLPAEHPGEMTEEAGSLLRDCLSQLPALELAVFKYVVNHLSRVAQHSGMIILRRDIKDFEPCKLYVQNWGQI